MVALSIWIHKHCQARASLSCTTGPTGPQGAMRLLHQQAGACLTVFVILLAARKGFQPQASSEPFPCAIHTIQEQSCASHASLWRLERAVCWSPISAVGHGIEALMLHRCKLLHWGKGQEGEGSCDKPRLHSETLVCRTERFGEEVAGPALLEQLGLVQVLVGPQHKQATAALWLFTASAFSGLQQPTASIEPVHRA